MSVGCRQSEWGPQLADSGASRSSKEDGAGVTGKGEGGGGGYGDGEEVDAGESEKEWRDPASTFVSLLTPSCHAKDSVLKLKSSLLQLPINKSPKMSFLEISAIVP